MCGSPRNESDLPRFLHGIEHRRLHLPSHRLGLGHGYSPIEAGFDVEAQRAAGPSPGKVGLEHTRNDLGGRLPNVEDLWIDAVHEVMHQLRCHLVSHVENEQGDREPAIGSPMR